MKSLLKRIRNRCSPRNPIAKAGYIVLFLLVFLLGELVTVQARINSSHGILARKDTFTAPRLAVAVHQIENTTVFRVNFTNGTASPVTIRLKNEKGELLFREVVNEPVYIRKFNMAALPDAHYYFELQNKEESQVKEIVLQTTSTRNLVIQ
jgi:hypothetical protein